MLPQKITLTGRPQGGTDRQSVRSASPRAPSTLAIVRERAPPDFLVDDVGHFSPAVLGLSSSKGVGHGLLLPCDEINQPFLDARVERRRLIAVQPIARQRIGTLLGSLLAFRQPLLVGIVVGDRGAIERSLEIGLGVGAAKVVAPRTNLADGVH